MANNMELKVAEVAANMEQSNADRKPAALKLNNQKVADLFARVAFHSPVIVTWGDGSETAEPGAFKLRSKGKNTVDGDILARGIDVGYQWTVQNVASAVMMSSARTLAQAGVVPADSALASQSAELKSDGLRVWLASLDAVRKLAAEERGKQDADDRLEYARLLRGTGKVKVEAGSLLAK